MDAGCDVPPWICTILSPARLRLRPWLSLLRWDKQLCMFFSFVVWFCLLLHGKIDLEEKLQKMILCIVA